ncbi:MAG: glutathione peroxidase [Acidovorax sp. 17-64-282]|nr:MAG: glutathione peroxidase [Acidovorax sp. 17-64-282]
MKSLSRLSMALRIAGVAGLMLTGGAAYAGEVQACPATLQHTFDRLQDEKPQSLCQYSGKVVLIVNTASYCGFTGQYKGLEDLYARYKDKGLVVKFPMFAKSSVKGPEASPLYRQLAQLSGTGPRWNFHKYLLGRNGQLVDSYSSLTAPDSKGLVRAIEQQLAATQPK